MSAEAKRDRWGRYLIINGNGPAKPYTRATTVASTLSDNFGLTNWKMRTLAVGLAQRDDIYARVAAVDPTDKTTLDKLCQDALEAGRSSVGANYGTALHEATARIDSGETVTMPAPWNADLDAYRATLAHTNISIDRAYIEQICVLDSVQVAGTFDRIIILPDGSHAIADLKTGQSLDYSWHEIAIQLAIYAHADAIYNAAIAIRSAFPSVRQDIGIVVHLPAGKATCTIHEVDLIKGWEAAELALTVRRWRQDKAIASPYSHLGPVIAPEGRRTAMKARLEQLRDLGHLEVVAQQWPAGVPGFKTEHVHTVVELDAIETVVNDVEQLTGAPF